MAPGVVVALSSAVGVWLAWRVFVDTWAGQRVERATLQGARYGQNRLWHVAEPILSVVSIWFIVIVVLVAVLVAILRRRWMLAAQVAVLMAGANLTTRVLKVGLIDRPDLGIPGPGFNTLPSGHTTAAASVAAVVVLVVPPRVRPWAAVFGGLYTAATGVSTLVGQWHRPSDVIAAILVVLCWSGVACALVAWRPGPARRGPTGAPTTATAQLALAAGTGRGSSGTRTGAVLLLLVTLVALVPATLALHRSWTTGGQLSTRGELLTAYAGGASGVVAASALGFAILLVLRHVTTARVGAA
ncbi:phosphoesterase PA-phosphatase [Cellulomonas sp. WB94]|nr:phosphoesterase PA-phosphatase [Cellulomonas sp. WB94]